MNNFGVKNNLGCVQLRRRSFVTMLLTAAVGCATASLAKFSAEKKTVMQDEIASNSIGRRSSQRRVFIFQDTAHFEASDLVDTYQPPKVMTSTRDYINNTDQVTFLQRHWFV